MKTNTDGPAVIRVSPLVHASEQLKGLIDEKPDSDIILDVSDLGFATSMLLNELLELRICLIGRGHELIICCIDERVRGIFDVTGLDNVFRIVNSQTEALAAFNETDHMQTSEKHN